MTIVATLLNGLRSGVDRNPVGNRGFSHFSADALVLPFPVSTAQQVDHLQAMRILGMIDVLVYGLVVNGLPWMFDSDPSRDLLRRPSSSQAVLHILPYEIVL